MHKQKAEELIRRLKDQDAPSEEIVGKLTEAGYSGAEIAEAFLAVEKEVLARELAKAGAPAFRQAGARRLPLALDLFREAFYIYRSRFPVLLAIVVLPLLFYFAGAFFLAFPGALFVTLSALAFLAGLVTYLLSSLALFHAVREEMDVPVAYRLAMRDFLPYYWINALNVFTVLGGFVLGIIPGLIFIIWFAFSIYIFLDEGERGMKALAKSRYYVQGRWFEVFGKMLAPLLLAVLLSIAINIPASLIGARAGELLNLALQVVFVPFFVIYGYRLYRHLRGAKPLVAPPPAGSSTKLFIFCAAVGVVVPLALLAIALFLFFSGFPSI